MGQDAASTQPSSLRADSSQKLQDKVVEDGHVTPTTFCKNSQLRFPQINRKTNSACLEVYTRNRIGSAPRQKSADVRTGGEQDVPDFRKQVNTLTPVAIATVPLDVGASMVFRINDVYVHAKTSSKAV